MGLDIDRPNKFVGSAWIVLHRILIRLTINHKPKLYDLHNPSNNKYDVSGAIKLFVIECVVNEVL